MIDLEIKLEEQLEELREELDRPLRGNGGFYDWLCDLLNIK